jgi:putative RNA 2'-phosphotransferase
MTAIRSCPDHGPFAGERCPDCDAAGSPVVSSSNRTRVSKFLSGALRHFPDDVGLTLDAAGWTSLAAVVDRTQERYDWLADGAVEAIVRLDPKGRFERDGERIRAAYGHSVAVDLADGETLESTEMPVPDVLYHGTSPDALESIETEGLRPMGRQYVHLSGSVAAARTVGRRHADEPVVLAVDAAELRRDGQPITKRGRSVFTTDRVPPAYLSRHD